MNIHQEGNLTGTGEGHAHVPKGKPSGKKTDLAKQSLLAGIQVKKKNFRPVEERAAIQEDNKDAME